MHPGRHRLRRRWRPAGGILGGLGVGDAVVTDVAAARTPIDDVLALLGSPLAPAAGARPRRPEHGRSGRRRRRRRRPVPARRRRVAGGWPDEGRAAPRGVVLARRPARGRRVLAARAGVAARSRSSPSSTTSTTSSSTTPCRSPTSGSARSAASSSPTTSRARVTMHVQDGLELPGRQRRRAPPDVAARREVRRDAAPAPTTTTCDVTTPPDRRPRRRRRGHLRHPGARARGRSPRQAVEMLSAAVGHRRPPAPSIETGAVGFGGRGRGAAQHHRRPRPPSSSTLADQTGNIVSIIDGLDAAAGDPRRRRADARRPARQPGRRHHAAGRRTASRRSTPSQALTRLARDQNELVFQPYLEATIRQIQQLDAILAELAAGRAEVGALLDWLINFIDVVPPGHPVPTRSARTPPTPAGVRRRRLRPDLRLVRPGGAGGLGASAATGSGKAADRRINLVRLRRSCSADVMLHVGGPQRRHRRRHRAALRAQRLRRRRQRRRHQRRGRLPRACTIGRVEQRRAHRRRGRGSRLQDRPRAARSRSARSPRIFRKSAIGEPYIDFQPAGRLRSRRGRLLRGRRRDRRRHRRVAATPPCPLEFSELLRTASDLISSIDPAQAGVAALRARHSPSTVGARTCAGSPRPPTPSRPPSPSAPTPSTASPRTTPGSPPSSPTTGRPRLAITDSPRWRSRCASASGDTEVLLDRGTALLTLAADLVEDARPASTASSSDLVAGHGATAAAGPPRRPRATSSRPARRASACFDTTVDHEPDGPWVRVNLRSSLENPPGQYVPPLALPAVQPPCDCPGVVPAGAVSAAGRGSAGGRLPPVRRPRHRVRGAARHRRGGRRLHRRGARCSPPRRPPGHVASR